MSSKTIIRIAVAVLALILLIVIWNKCTEKWEETKQDLKEFPFPANRTN